MLTWKNWTWNLNWIELVESIVFCRDALWCYCLDDIFLGWTRPVESLSHDIFKTCIYTKKSIQTRLNLNWKHLKTHRHRGGSPSAQTRRIRLPSGLSGGRWGGGRSRWRAAMTSALRGRWAVIVASSLSAVCSQRNGLHYLRYKDTRKHW